VNRVSSAIAASLTTLALAPAVAHASTGVGLPIVSPSSATVAPPGFSSNADQAMAAAKATSTMRAIHAREHPLFIKPWVWGTRKWFVTFAYRDKVVAEVDVSPSGRVMHVWTGPLALAVYGRGHFAPTFDSAWVLVPFCLMFALPFLDPRRLRRMLHLDAAVLLAFLISYGLFDHGHLQTAVWLVYPPLLYLLVRMAQLGFGGRVSSGRLAPLLSTRVLVVGLLVLVAARVVLSLANHEVVDVGYASVIGAHRLIGGQSLYWAGAAHGDTYGPIAYLAYVPFVLLFPWHGAWDYLPSAHAASLFFDLVTVAALVLLGRRLRPGPHGRRLGLLLGWAWSACPFTLLGLMMHTNDGLVAMLSVLALLLFASPGARGAMLGLAAAAKFSPAALLPLLASPRHGGRRGALVCLGCFGLVVAAAVGLYLPSGGLDVFYSHTIGYQLTRPDVFSPWALHPGLDPLKLLFEGVVLVLAAAVWFVPRRRSLAQVSALAAAITIAVQVPAVHWFYYYVVWFVPFVLVALFSLGVSKAENVLPQAQVSAPGAALSEHQLVRV